MTFHSIFKLESMPTEPEDGLEHPVTGDSGSDGMVAFIPYMLMSYIVVLIQALKHPLACSHKQVLQPTTPHEVGATTHIVCVDKIID